MNPLCRPAFWLLASAAGAWAQGGEATPRLAEIDPPVPVFPYPMWMVACAAAAALLLLALLILVGARFFRNRPAPPPLPPRERALAALAALRGRAPTEEPYPFSIEVSDVLRTFVTEEYRVSARERTSPEFLAAASCAPCFSEGDKALLAAFLERADLIKFARVHASAADSEQLLEQALRFVKGGGQVEPV